VVDEFEAYRFVEPRWARTESRIACAGSQHQLELNVGLRKLNILFSESFRNVNCAPRMAFKHEFAVLNKNHKATVYSVSVPHHRGPRANRPRLWKAGVFQSKKVSTSSVFIAHVLSLTYYGFKLSRRQYLRNQQVKNFCLVFF